MALKPPLPYSASVLALPVLGALRYPVCLFGSRCARLGVLFQLRDFETAHIDVSRSVTTLSSARKRHQHLSYLVCPVWYASTSRLRGLSRMATTHSITNQFNWKIGGVVLIIPPSGHKNLRETRAKSYRETLSD